MEGTSTFSSHRELRDTNQKAEKAEAGFRKETVFERLFLLALLEDCKRVLVSVQAMATWEEQTSVMRSSSMKQTRSWEDKLFKCSKLKKKKSLFFRPVFYQEMNDSSRQPLQINTEKNPRMIFSDRSSICIYLHNSQTDNLKMEAANFRTTGDSAPWRRTGGSHKPERFNSFPSNFSMMRNLLC